MSNLTPAVFFAALFGSVLVWFGLVIALFRRLRLSHTDKYREMGEPNLVTNNTPRTTIALLKFLFKREDRVLADTRLSRLIALMLAFFVCYSVAFLYLFGITLASVFIRHAP